MTGTQLNTLLSKLIDSFVTDNNSSIVGDIDPELLADPDQRDEAVDSLINYIEHNREFI